MSKKDMVILLLILSILYLNISNVASLINNHNNNNNNYWDVRITDFKRIDINGKVVEKAKESHTILTASYDLFFKEVGDSITYELTIKNNAKIDAKLEEIVISTNNDNLLYEISGINNGDILKSGEEVKCKLYIKYVKYAPYVFDNQRVIFNYVQK